MWKAELTNGIFEATGATPEIAAANLDKKIPSEEGDNPITIQPNGNEYTLHVYIDEKNHNVGTIRCVS